MRPVRYRYTFWCRIGKSYTRGSARIRAEPVGMFGAEKSATRIRKTSQSLDPTKQGQNVTPRKKTFHKGRGYVIA